MRSAVTNTLCVTRRKLQTHGTAEEKKGHETPTIYAAGALMMAVLVVW